MTLLGPVCAFASSITWAFSSTRYSAAAHHVSGVRVNFARALFAGAIWSVFALVTRGDALFEGISLAQFGWLSCSIICSYVLGDGVFFAAALRVGVPSALAVATIYPLWAALYGVLFRAEVLGPWRVVGLAGCVCGVVALLRQSSGSAHGMARSPRTAAFGIALALLTSLFWAGNAVCLKQGAEELALEQANAARFAVGALLLAPRLLLLKRSEVGESVSMFGVVRSLWLPLCIDTVVGSLCYVYGLAHSDLALGVTLSSLSPLAALPLAMASGAERITPGRALCVIAIVASVVALMVG